METQNLLHCENEMSYTEEKHEPAITPGGSFSPGVNELIQSFKPQTRTHHRTASGGSIQSFKSHTHRRTGSGGSAKSLFKLHRRQGSNGSGKGMNYTKLDQAHKGDSLQSTPVKSRSRSNSVGSAHRGRSSVDHTPTHRSSNSSIPYAKFDLSDSESSDQNTDHESEDSLTFGPHTSTSTAGSHSAQSAPKALKRGASNGSVKFPEKQEGSNDSSGDAAGSDGHEADSESNNGDCESGDDSNKLSSLPASPFTSETDDMTSCSTPDFLAKVDFPSPDVALSSEQLLHKDMVAEPKPSTPEADISNVTVNDPTLRPVFPSTNAATLDDDCVQEAVSQGSLTSTGFSQRRPHGQVAMLISQFECSSHNSASQASLLPARLEIPFHIRRDIDDVSGTYSPAKVEEMLGSLDDSMKLGSTILVRHFFENVGSKPALRMQTSSTGSELEDSGFQVRSRKPLTVYVLCM